MKKTPEEICQAVSLDLKKRGITHAKAAEMIGKSTAIVSNQLCGKPFSKNLAELFANAFGYDEVFLLFGKGQLFKVPIEASSKSPMLLTDFLDPELTGAFINILELLLLRSENHVAIDAWQALLSGDYEDYCESIDKLSYKKGNNFFSMILFGKKVADYFRSQQRNQNKEIYEAPPIESFEQ